VEEITFEGTEVSRPADRDFAPSGCTVPYNTATNAADAPTSKREMMRQARVEGDFIDAVILLNA
jgi:hypothetical protein